MPIDQTLANEPYCYLTTTGRRSGEPREIEIWFAAKDDSLYLLAGGREKAHWVRNIQANPAVAVRIASRRFKATARIVSAGTPEDAAARTLLFDKYTPGYDGDLTDWRETALTVALDLQHSS